MKLNTEAIALLRYALNYSGNFTEKGQPIPKSYGKEDEKMYTDITSKIDTVIKKEVEKNKEVAEVEVKLSLEERAWIVRQMDIPWEPQTFAGKNKLISLLEK